MFKIILIILMVSLQGCYIYKETVVSVRDPSKDVDVIDCNAIQETIKGEPVARYTRLLREKQYVVVSGVKYDVYRFATGDKTVIVMVKDGLIIEGKCIEKLEI